MMPLMGEQHCTSDHMPQMTRIAVGHETFEGMTWNVLSQGIATSEFTNNPFYFEENSSEYTARRAKQRHFILDIVANRILSFICLQEATCPPEIDGFERVDTLDHSTVRNLVTFYNKSILKLIHIGFRLLHETGKYQALETVFESRSSKEIIYVLNVHLIYSATVEERVPLYLLEPSFVTVVCGDFNSPMVRYMHRASNSKATTFDGRKYPHHPTRHEGNENILKEYDGFIVSSNSNECITTDTLCGQFHVDQICGVAKVRCEI